MAIKIELAQNWGTSLVSILQLFKVGCEYYDSKTQSQTFYADLNRSNFFSANFGEKMGETI